MIRGARVVIGMVLVSVTFGCGQQSGRAEAVQSKHEAQLKARWRVSPSAPLPAPVVAAAGGTNARAAASKSQVLVASYELGLDGKRVLAFARSDAQYELIDPSVRAVAPKLQVKIGDAFPGFAVASDGESFLIVGVSIDGDELLGATVGADGQIGDPFSVGPCSNSIPNGIALASDGTGYVAAWVDGQAFRGAHIDTSQRASTPIDFGAAAPASNAGDAPPSLAANDAGYLLTWVDKAHAGVVNGLRLNIDGTPKDTAGFQVLAGAWPSVASDGHDFLVVGLASDTGSVIAQRVGAAGAKLGTTLVIEAAPDSRFWGQAPTIAFVGSSFVTAYWDSHSGGEYRRSFISQDVTTATAPASLTVSGTQLFATATPTGALFVAGAYATPISSQLELGASVLMEAKPASRQTFHSAALGAEYLIAWQEEAPAFEAPEQRLKAVRVASSSSSSAPDPVPLMDAFDANSGAKFGDLTAVVADENGYLFSGTNGRAYVGKSPFKSFVPPSVWPWAAGRSGYLTATWDGALRALDTDGNVLSGSGATLAKPCIAIRSCTPMSIAHSAGGYAVLWGNGEKQTSDSERAAVTLTDDEGNVVVSKIIDSPNDVVATAIVSNGAGYLVFVPEALNSTTNEWTARTVLQLDTDLNVVASNPTELLVREFRAFNERYSDVVVSGGEYYAVYDKQRWQNELPNGPLWFAHLAADGTIADEFEVIAETTGAPVLAAAGADSFLLTTSASETMFIQRDVLGGDDAGGAGAGGAPASGDGESPAEVSGGAGAGGIDGAGEAPEDESSAGAAGGDDGQGHAAPPKTSHDSSCRTAVVGAPAGASFWPTLLALGLVGLARRRR